MGACSHVEYFRQEWPYSSSNILDRAGIFAPCWKDHAQRTRHTNCFYTAAMSFRVSLSSPLRSLPSLPPSLAFINLVTLESSLFSIKFLQPMSLYTVYVLMLAHQGSSVVLSYPWRPLLFTMFSISTAFAVATLAAKYPAILQVRVSAGASLSTLKDSGLRLAFGLTNVH